VNHHLYKIFDWRSLAGCALTLIFLAGCSQENMDTTDMAEQESLPAASSARQGLEVQANDEQNDDFDYEADRLADIRIMRYNSRMGQFYPAAKNSPVLPVPGRYGRS